MKHQIQKKSQGLTGLSPLNLHRTNRHSPRGRRTTRLLGQRRLSHRLRADVDRPPQSGNSCQTTGDWRIRLQKYVPSTSLRPPATSGGPQPTAGETAAARSSLAARHQTVRGGKRQCRLLCSLPVPWPYSSQSSLSSSSSLEIVIYQLILIINFTLSACIYRSFVSLLYLLFSYHKLFQGRSLWCSDRGWQPRRP